jgi:hypothetical protein
MQNTQFSNFSRLLNHTFDFVSFIFRSFLLVRFPELLMEVHSLGKPFFLHIFDDGEVTSSVSVMSSTTSSSTKSLPLPSASDDAISLRLPLPMPTATSSAHDAHDDHHDDSTHVEMQMLTSPMAQPSRTSVTIAGTPAAAASHIDLADQLHVTPGLFFAFTFLLEPSSMTHLSLDST